MDDNLRQYFKIKRDVKKRKYKKSKIIQEINRRKKDSNLYIKTQKKYADIIFQINPSNKDILKKKYKKKWLDTKIKLILRKKINKPLFKEVLKKISANSDEILAISPGYMDKECGIIQFIILFFIFDRINEERKNTKLFF